MTMQKSCLEEVVQILRLGQLVDDVAGRRGAHPLPEQHIMRQFRGHVHVDLHIYVDIHIDIVTT